MNADSIDFDFAMGSSTRWPLASPGVARRVELSALLRRIMDCVTSRGILPLQRCWRVTVMAFASAPKTGAEGTAVPCDPAANDWADVLASLGGNHDAYAQLIRRYQEPIAAYMWRFTRDPRDRDELVHEVFVDSYIGLANYSRRAPLFHWLKRIATRVGYRYWKSRQRRHREVPLSDSTDLAATKPNAIESARHAAEVVHSILAQLAPRDRLVMTLIYLESHSLAEVARLTGWTATMVKVQAHRARKRLAKICAQAEVEL
jgi:RNA polymerase sigma-70 factor, ECF subfamily